ncbi:MAG: class I SAM-dependent methyltransferase [Pseudomonadota bacterium]
MGQNYKIRSICRLCCNLTLKKVVDLPLTVPGEQLKKTIAEIDPEEIPIDLYQCEKCGHVQVVHVPPPKTLFGSDYTFMPSNNPVLVEHFKKSVDYFIDKFNKNLTFAFEIGSNDGFFLDQLRKATGCKILGVDPSSKPVKIARNNDVETILDYFTKDLAKNIISDHGKPDLIIANNIFAHMDDLRGVLDGIQMMLENGGYFMFEASYLKDVVEKHLIGTIIHEHLSVHSIYSLVPFLNEFGLNLIGVKHVNDVQGGAIVGVAQKCSKKEIPSQVQNYITQEHECGITNFSGMHRFNSSLKTKLQSFKEKIYNMEDDTIMVGYGAARAAPLIIDLLGLRDKIKYIMDDNPFKKGKYMPISNIPIIGSNEHKQTAHKTIYIILGWAQTDRIIEKLRKFENNCKAITIYPHFNIQTIN